MVQNLARSITRFLTSPGKIAQALDWRKQAGAVLSLHVGTSSIDLAVTLHPSADENPIQPLPSIPIETEVKGNSKVLKSHILKELSKIADDWNVCGIVTSWPVQKEGWCGASCGKVLHTLDQIVQETSLVSKKRPLCLWDGHHYLNTEDEWGRIARYGVPSEKHKHCASTEQYHDEGMVASEIAQDYIRCHWPSVFENREGSRPVATSRIAAPTGKPKGLLVDPKWIGAYSSSSMPAQKASLY